MKRYKMLRETDRWIASLTDDDRDEIITHPNPTYDCEAWRSPDGCGCLVGCVVIRRGFPEGTPTSLYHSGGLSQDGWGQWLDVGGCAVCLAIDFTPERFWAFAKRRAAHHSGSVSAVALPEVETVEVAP